MLPFRFAPRAVAGVLILAAAAAAHAASVPDATTLAATAVTASAARLNGNVSANGAKTSVYLDYGPSTAYGTTLDATPDKVNPSSTSAVATDLAGLSCATTYHFRVRATNRIGTGTGADASFTTAACMPPPPPPPPTPVAPTVTTNAATNVTAAGATLGGSVVPGSATATNRFEYGATTSYGTTVAATPATLAASTSSSPVSASLVGLACATTYHYRAGASSSAGAANGADQAFTTAPCPPPPPTPVAPTATTNAATNVAAASATLNGSVVPGSATATITFEYGATTSYGNTIAATPSALAASTSTFAVSAPLTGLACASTYHHRVKASSSAGTGNGSDQAFTTAACSTGSGSVRVSVGGFGHVTSDIGNVSCGSVPSGSSASGTRCFASSVSGTVTFTAVPYNASFVFAGWAGDAACSGNVCPVPATGAKWVRAKFVPAGGANSCTALGLVGDKTNHPLNGNFPALAVGQSFTDPNFGTTIRRLTDVHNDGRGGRVLKPAYSTISAWNSDETYLVLYRVGSGHELYHGKTYAYVRTLTDLPTADLEQFYWDTTNPNLLYGVNSSTRVMYRYDVNAAAGQRLTALRDFTAQCGTRTLSGGDDPFYSSWDSRSFGMACVSGGTMFGYDPIGNAMGATAGSAEPRASSYASPQAVPSGRRLFLNQPSPSGANAVRLYDLNMVRGAFLDQGNGDDHGTTNMTSSGSDTYNAIQFDPGPSGTGEGSLVQWNLDSAPNGSNRIVGRVIVGPAMGFPYPPGGTHLGGTSFNRTGLVAMSIQGTMNGASVLDGELLLVDTDAATNPGNAACRVGHHRTKSTEYWAEPHATISPSGTRILFGSSWGDTSSTPTVNAYVVELPGYRP